MASFACSVLCLCVLMTSCAAADTRPNILLLLIDDLRPDVLSHAGHEFFESPHIDRLAEEGTRFADAFVITSVCSPSRATIFTGRYTHEHGVWSIWAPLDSSLPTVPKALHDAGYRTGFIGKWHLSRTDESPEYFDRWVSFRGHGRYDNPTISVD